MRLALPSIDTRRWHAEAVHLLQEGIPAAVNDVPMPAGLNERDAIVPLCGVCLPMWCAGRSHLIS